MRQKVIATLGRTDELAARGGLASLLASGARYCEQVLLLSTLQADLEGPRVLAKRIGAPLLFERLWEETGCRAVIEDLLAERRFEFPVERAIFATVLHRIMVSGSDRACEKWMADYAISGVDGLTLHHLYRAMAWLGEELPADQQGGATPFAPRTVKDLIEEQLFARRRDLFSELSVVFMDTTSLSFTGAGGETLGRAGLLQGPPPRPDADDRRRGDRRRGPAGLLGDVARQHRRCQRARPGHRSPAQPLRHRSGLCGGRSRHDLGPDHRRPRGARAGIRARRPRAHRQPGAHRGARGTRSPSRRSVSNGPGARRPSSSSRRSRPRAGATSCAATKPRRARTPPTAKPSSAALDQQLKRGDKALIGNSAYRRYLRATSKKAFEIDPGKLADEARYDGVFVLRTNARITPLQAVLRYRDLIQVEQLFRTAKALMRTRPIYHSSDAAIRGHVFCSFLALILRKELDERCRKAGLRPEWGDVLRDLDRLQDVAITKDGRHITLRTPATGLIGPLFKAAHIALPPNIRDASAA